MIREYVEAHRSYFESGVTRQVPVRQTALKRLKRVLLDMEDEILQALSSDFGKPRFEGYIGELAVIHEELDHTLKHLEEWARPEGAGRSIATLMNSAAVHKEPLGVVLIIVPFNYPVQLALVPLISAVAAGNTVVIKMSSLTPGAGRVLKKVIQRSFRPGHCGLIEGGEGINDEVMAQRYDKILFTGGREAGLTVARKAAETLTPVMLELAGRNPVIVLRDADVVMAARSIAWGRFFNAGQTCIAPNHVYVHRQIRTAFLEEMKLAIHEFYGDDPSQSPDFGRIISDESFDRLKGLLAGDIEIQAGGQARAEDRYIAPTLVTGVPKSHPLLASEIFGPILPILEYSDINGLIRELREGETPLASYVFSQDAGFAQKVMARIPSAGSCINETMLHVASPLLPFGGTGASGNGIYHGRYGFEAFTHLRAVLTGHANLSAGMVHPPYSSLKEKSVRGFLRARSSRRTS